MMRSKIRPLIPLFSLLLISSLTGCQLRMEDEATGGPVGPSGPHPNANKKAGGGVMDKDEAEAEAKEDAGNANDGLPGVNTGGQFPKDDNATGVDPNNPSGADSSDTSGTDPVPECNDVDPVKLFLSPDDSNSLSSPSQLKERLLGTDTRTDLYGIPIRGWEFFNYYTFPYAEPEGTLGAHLELRPLGDTPGHYRMQIGVRSKRWAYETRPAMNLTFVLDTSGSMEGPALDMLKASVRAIAGGLRKGDKVSLLTWSSSQQVLLDSHTVTTAGDPVLLQISDQLQTGGGTDLHGGLQRGYELAQKNFMSGAINRVILVSDGGANLGIVSKELIGKYAKDSGQDGIYLAGVGVGGESTYNDALMDEVTDAGKGASVFIPNDAEARRIFGDNFLSTLGIAAKNVRVQLDMPPGFEIVKFSGEEMDTDPTKVEPQHLGPNDSMVFFQEIKNCAPEKFDPNAKITVTVRYHDALTHQPGQLVVESSFAQLTAAPAPALGKGTALTAFVDALKARQDQKPDANALMVEAKRVLGEEIANAPADVELKELLQQLTRLAPN